jgi:hypothetical protein
LEVIICRLIFFFKNRNVYRNLLPEHFEIKFPELIFNDEAAVMGHFGQCAMTGLNPTVEVLVESVFGNVIGNF